MKVRGTHPQSPFSFNSKITNHKMECVGMKARIGCRRNATDVSDATIQIPVQLICGNALLVTERDIRQLTVVGKKRSTQSKKINNKKKRRKRN